MDRSHGSWNYITAVCLCMFTAAWAAENKHPVKAGAVAGAALLFNVSAAMAAPVVAVLAVTNKTTSTKQKLVWLGNATAAAVAVAGWFLIPFTQRMLAGQWQDWPVTLGQSLSQTLANQPIMIFAVVAGAAIAAGRHDGAKRLSIAAAAGAGAMLIAAAAGFSRPERFATLALIAAVAAAAAAHNPAQTIKQQATPANIRAGLLGVAAVAATYAAVWGFGRDGTAALVDWGWHWLLWVALPLTFAAMQLRKPKQPAQVGILVWVALIATLATLPPNDTAVPADATARQQLSENVSGTVMISHWWGENQTEPCDTRPLRAVLENNDEPVRIIDGLYKEADPSAEFLHTERYLQRGYWDNNKRIHKPGWVTAWTQRNKPALNTAAAAAAIGADWHAACRSDGQYTLKAVHGTKAEGITPAFYPEHDGWHHATLDWWFDTNNNSNTHGTIPVHGTNPHPGRHPTPARNVTAELRKNQVVVTAGEAGWVWIKTSHDPWWTADTDSTIHKGGPGHIILHVDKGRTVLTWQRPDHVRNTTIAVEVAAFAWIAAALWFATARRRQLNQKHRRLKTRQQRPVTIESGNIQPGNIHNTSKRHPVQQTTTRQVTVNEHETTPRNNQTRCRQQQRCHRNSPNRGLTPRHPRPDATNNPQIAQQLAGRRTQQSHRHSLEQPHPQQQQYPHDQPTPHTFQKRTVSGQRQQHPDRQQPSQQINNPSCDTQPQQRRNRASQRQQRQRQSLTQRNRNNGDHIPTQSAKQQRTPPNPDPESGCSTRQTMRSGPRQAQSHTWPQTTATHQNIGRSTPSTSKTANKPEPQAAHTTPTDNTSTRPQLKPLAKTTPNGTAVTTATTTAPTV